MNLEEYNKIKDLTYVQYCDYLQEKYGIGICDYMDKFWNKNKQISRTNEGLFAHHKFEDHAIMLSHQEYAKHNPYKWQLAKNIVYCDYLEHLLLHILICEYPAKNKNKYEDVGIGGVVNFIVPTLNDFYSGWQSSLPWQENCLNVIKNDKDVYIALLRRFKKNCNQYSTYTEDCLHTSFNEENGSWSADKNNDLFKEI